MLGRFGSSLRARWACRRGEGMSQSPELLDAGLGEDNLVRLVGGTLARFLLPGDDVEHGGDNGGHGGAWGFPNRRR
jgi:hypothetical protein